MTIRSGENLMLENKTMKQRIQQLEDIEAL